MFGNRRIRLYRSLENACRSGVGALSGLQMHAEDSDARILRPLIEHLLAGGRLGEVMRRHPESFPLWQAEVVSVGESTGRLDEAFRSMAEILEERRDFWMSLLPQLAYPLFLIHLAPFLLNTSELVTNGAGAYLQTVLRFLLKIYAPVALAWGLWYFLLRRLISVSGLPMFRQLAKAEFSEYVSMMLAAGLAVGQSIDKGLTAAGMERMSPPAGRDATATEHFAATGVFTREELNHLHSAETSGSLDAAARQLSKQARLKWQMGIKTVGALLPTIIFLVIAVMIASKIIGFYSNYFANLPR